MFACISNLYSIKSSFVIKCIPILYAESRFAAADILMIRSLLFKSRAYCVKLLVATVHMYAQLLYMLADYSAAVLWSVVVQGNRACLTATDRLFYI